MLIDNPGKYTTKSGIIADIFRVDRTTAIGRLPDVSEVLVWDDHTGEAMGHPLENSLVGKHRNLPAVAMQMTQILGDLDTNQQRLQVINIFRQQVCLDCGNVPEPGLPCPCQAKRSGKKGTKRVN
jgi:hypothetical protein